MTTDLDQHFDFCPYHPGLYCQESMGCAACAKRPGSIEELMAEGAKTIVEEDDGEPD